MPVYTVVASVVVLLHLQLPLGQSAPSASGLLLSIGANCHIIIYQNFFAKLPELLPQLKVHFQVSRARAWLVPGIVSSEPAAAPSPERIFSKLSQFELGLSKIASSESACLSLPEILQSSLSLQLGPLQPSLLRRCSRVVI